MSQHQNMYLDQSNRSPSARHAYGGGGGGAFNPSMPPRGGQRPAGANAYGMDMPPGFAPRGLDAIQPAYMDNTLAWNYNSANVATINGAMNGPNRQRSVNRRAPIPNNWPDHQVGLGLHGGMGFGVGGTHGGNGGQMMRLDQPLSQSDLRGAGHGGDADQLIPTAIVIKNIPFAVRKETLAQIMVDMALPQPYAFNYHFDNGIFRGLAFANFQSPEDTRMVIDAMNGLEVQNRKLRVEYKKMLPEAERERIEREKRERRGQLEEQHRGPMLQQQSSMQSLSGMSNSQGPRHAGQMPDHVNLNDPETLGFYTDLAMFRRDEYREILVFPASTTPEQRRLIHILAHHMGLEHQSQGNADNRQIHVIKNLPSPTTQVQALPPAAGNMDANRRGLSRAATFDLAESRSAALGSYNAVGRHGPTLELPGSPDGSAVHNNLRAAKSFADLRSFSPTPSQASSSYLNPAPNGMTTGGANTGHFGAYNGVNPSHPMMGASVQQGHGIGTPGPDASLLASTLGGLNLGSYDVGAGSQPRSTPGAIGSQRPSASQAVGRNAPERQPRGPEWEPTAGFGRARENGHMHRRSADEDAL